MSTHPEVFASYQQIFKRKNFCEHMTCAINPNFHVGFCERDANTILLATVGLAQARLNEEVYFV